MEGLTVKRVAGQPGIAVYEAFNVFDQRRFASGAGIEEIVSVGVALLHVVVEAGCSLNPVRVDRASAHAGFEGRSRQLFDLFPIDSLAVDYEQTEDKGPQHGEKWFHCL